MQQRARTDSPFFTKPQERAVEGASVSTGGDARSVQVSTFGPGGFDSGAAGARIRASYSPCLACPVQAPEPGQLRARNCRGRASVSGSCAVRCPGAALAGAVACASAILLLGLTCGRGLCGLLAGLRGACVGCWLDRAGPQARPARPQARRVVVRLSLCLSAAGMTCSPLTHEDLQACVCGL